jgi:Tfp pilus assembly protein PilZ
LLRRQQSGFDRVPFVQICDFEGGGARRRVLLCNLSVLGAYVHLENPPETGSEVTLSFRLPDDGTLVLAEAQVTWVNDSPAESVTAMPVGCGVRFTSVAPDDVRRIALLVRTFLAAPEGETQLGVGVPRSGVVRIPFIAACAFQGEEGESSGSVCNLSVLGVYAALDRIPEVGERGRVVFPIPGSAKPFVAEVAVAWHNPEFARRMQALPPGCGLRFEGLPAAERSRLSAVVEAYLRSPESAKTGSPG